MWLVYTTRGCLSTTSSNSPISSPRRR
jgi:hypothetical protein